jgi:GT2 family glycosyltransferase
MNCESIVSCCIILNWCSFDQTVSCVDSALKTSVDAIILVDNASVDGSFERFLDYYSNSEFLYVKLFVVNSGSNKGYAGGNNFGINFAISTFPNVEYFWILNNDTFLESDAFLPLKKSVDENINNFYGSIVLNYDKKVECFGGGLIYPWLGKCKLVGKGVDVTSYTDDIRVDYLMGCSLLFHKSIIEKVGLMDESYFMYSEEIDWQWRAKKLGIGIKVVPESIIYHEGSGSSGGQSPFYFFYRNRAAIMLNKKFFGNTFAFISAINLSFITLIQNAKNKENVTFGIKGAWAGLFKGIKFD